MYSRLNEIRHTWVTFWKSDPAGYISPPWSPFSVHISVTISRITTSLSYVMSRLLTQPLDSIAEYYGESIAFYFAYMAFYTRYLISLSDIL